MSSKFDKVLRRFCSFFVGGILLCGNFSAHGAFLPQSRHQQYLPYVFFAEEQFAVISKLPGNIWTEVGSNFALYEFENSLWRSQVIVSGSVNFSLRHQKSTFDYRTETFDARFGLFLDMAVRDNVSVSIGVLHLSGHTADGLLDLELVSPNVGDNLLFLRGIYRGSFYRLGGTFKPFFDSDPKTKFFAADQFVEVFPWGISKDAAHPNFYLGLGVEEMGIESVDFTFHSQMGILFGDSTADCRKTVLRLIAGYYSGIDPRLKYAQLKNSKQSFFYFGMAVHL